MILTTKLHVFYKKLQNILLSVSPLVFHVPTNRFSTQHNRHLHRLKLSWSIYSASLSGLYFKSYSHHQHHQNFSSSAKTNNNNTVPRIFQAPPNCFTLHRACICIGLSSLDWSIRLPSTVYTSKVTSITKKNGNHEFCRHLQQQQQCPQNISSSTKPFYTASLVHL